MNDRRKTDQPLMLFQPALSCFLKPEILSWQIHNQIFFAVMVDPDQDLAVATHLPQLQATSSQEQPATND
jgi:hypothetical protein